MNQMFGKILQAAMAWIIPILLTLLVTFAGWTLYQMKQLRHYRDLSRELSANIEAIRRGVALTESLRKDNAIITQDQRDTLEELRNAIGRDIPLPPDIARTLDRMREQPPRP